MLVAEYLYNLDFPQRLFIMESKHFIIDVYKCMHVIYDMHDPNTEAYDPNTGSSME